MQTIGTLVATRLNEFLKLKKISLYTLAKRARVPLSSIKNIYTGNAKRPSVELLYKICYGLNITILEFLNSPIFSNEELRNLVL